MFFLLEGVIKPLFQAIKGEFSRVVLDEDSIYGLCTVIGASLIY